MGLASGTHPAFRGSLRVDDQAEGAAEGLDPVAVADRRGAASSASVRRMDMGFSSSLPCLARPKPPRQGGYATGTSQNVGADRSGIVTGGRRLAGQREGVWRPTDSGMHTCTAAQFGPYYQLPDTTAGMALTTTGEWGIRVVAPLTSDDVRAIGPYQLLRQLGRGRLGDVFLARPASGETVAVKVIRPELASDPWFRAQFGPEVAAARQVGGAFVSPVVDAEPDGDVPWLATAYVDGPTLAEAIRERGPVPAEALLMLASGLAEGLEAIHAAGLVHGNLHPSNVLLAEDGPRLADFGIAYAAASGLPGEGDGWPGFSSPEQALGEEGRPASDIFSLGAVLTFACTG